MKQTAHPLVEAIEAITPADDPARDGWATEVGVLVAQLSLTSDKVLSIREIADIYIRAINAGGGPSTDFSLLLMGAIPDGVEVVGREVVPSAILARHREILAAAAVTRYETQILLAMARRVAGNVMAVPVPITTARGVELATRYVSRNLDAALLVACVFCITNFGELLKRCGGCNMFFFAETGGRVGAPRDTYCTTECGTRALNKGRAHRVRASRAGETADSWRSIEARHPGITPAAWNRMKAQAKRPKRRA